MKKIVAGGFLSLVGSIWALAILVSASNSLVNEWVTETGRGRIDITAFEDPYLVEYLHRKDMKKRYYRHIVGEVIRWTGLMVIIPVRRE